MQSSSTRIGAATLTAALLAFALPHGIDAQQSVGVTVNGQPVNLSPAPIERAGRVFVPLRGVFERLGASVVYSNGQINATGNGRDISLRIGSTQATVNGQPQGLDVAPFIIGASTYVPLRFVAQALGDAVNWDNSNSIVAITTNGQVAQQPQPQRQREQPQQQREQPQQPARSPIQLEATQPANGTTVAANRPAIEARFAGANADPNSLKITLDQVDITAQTSRSSRGILYSPPSDLMPQRHTVDVRGNDTNGQPFDQRFEFVSGTRAAQTFLDVMTPQNNSTVGSTFTVRGKTMPNARVTVEAGGSASLAGILVLGTGTFRGDTTADANGNFAEDVSLNNSVPGGSINLVVTATDSQTKAAAPQVQRHLVRG
ncbi:MAG TPA: copper amine oxidase N-terminal domain-containing protein [Candidatus Binatia bacterium]|nr:copper amine oxidase N-terminal domain-containing protein [Candidatus Binatia bacterium]